MFVKYKGDFSIAFHLPATSKKPQPAFNYIYFDGINAGYLPTSNMEFPFQAFNSQIWK